MEGGASGMMPLVGRRGQLYFWNPFYRIASGNYNVCVFGPSGSGKSVFLQELTVNALAQEIKVFILDIGQSFKNICLLLGGEMVKFSADMDISINPFRTLTHETLVLYQAVISSMCGAKGNAEEAQIEMAIVNAFSKYKEQIDITKVRDELKALNTPESLKMSIALFTYTREGKYGRYFDRESDIHFNKPLTVFEFEEIKMIQGYLQWYYRSLVYKSFCKFYLEIANLNSC